MKASDIITRCQDILQDTTKVRWPDAELLRYLNDAQREVVKDRPDATAANASLTLVAGTKQQIPALGLKLIDVPRNMGADGTTPGRAIRIIDREALDAQRPDWHTESAESAIKHFMHDARDPLRFYVYPQASASPVMQVEVIYSAAPAELTELTDDIGVPVTYANALIDFTLYRAYSKDAEYTANINRAAGHYEAYRQALGLKGQVDHAMAPNRNAPPREGLR